jgi:hypothetical protein
MRKGTRVWMAAALLVLVIVGTVTLAFASPRTTTPNSLTVLAKLTRFHAVGKGIGARSVQQYAVFTADGSTRLGDLYGVFTQLDRDTVLGEMTYVQTQIDESQIVFGGFISLFNREPVVPISGGDGAFNRAKGEAFMTSSPKKLVITFQMS